MESIQLLYYVVSVGCSVTVVIVCQFCYPMNDLAMICKDLSTISPIVFGSVTILSWCI